MATAIKSGFGYIDPYKPAPKGSLTAETAVERRAERTEYKVSRGTIGKKGSGTYTKDVYNENSFCVDAPIYLESVGFFGPFEKTKQKYGVLLEVLRSEDVNHEGKLIFKYKTDGRCIWVNEKKIFHVSTKSLYLAPGYWYHIRFVLGGPDTAMLDEAKMDKVKAKVPVHPTGWAKEFKVRFQFLRGCRQMPELKFTVVPKQDLKTIRLPPAMDMRVNEYEGYGCVIS